jgi:uncharacterized coiled-coil DUF342 family protein
MNIRVTDKDLSKWLSEKDVLVTEGRELSKKIDALEEERNKCGMQIQKIKDKIIPLAESLAKPHFVEFDMLTTINLDGEEVVLEYVNQVAEFEKALREKIKNENTAQ